MASAGDLIFYLKNFSPIQKIIVFLLLWLFVFSTLIWFIREIFFHLSHQDVISGGGNNKSSPNHLMKMNREELFNLKDEIGYLPINHFEIDELVEFLHEKGIREYNYLMDFFIPIENES